VKQSVNCFEIQQFRSLRPAPSSTTVPILRRPCALWFGWADLVPLHKAVRERVEGILTQYTSVEVSPSPVDKPLKPPSSRP
jgi:hypothetical protein